MKKSIIFLILIFLLNSCGKNETFLPGGDARENPPEPQKRVKKNLEEGKGFRLDNMFKGKSGGGDFEFASSNELWRASLDVIDFIPLISANYSGGIIITDWYSEDQENFIKITIRFLSNEVRSDAIDIKIFYKLCDANMKCVTSKRESKLINELKTQILKKAAVYKQQTKDKNFKPYKGSGLKN
tara:strand:+ start:4242 stop:4793 length:552 start_codon:yes stop_codon:yes gene_type:complete